MTYFVQSRRREIDFWRGWTFGTVTGIVAAPIVVLLVLRIL